MAIVNIEARRPSNTRRTQPGQALRCPKCGLRLTYERRATERRPAALPLEAFARLKRSRDAQAIPHCVGCDVPLMPDDRLT
jgi:predicted RNA-binding Zn-ribbon protein involved in translation (DUF1610 family)